MGHAHTEVHDLSGDVHVLQLRAINYTHNTHTRILWGVGNFLYAAGRKKKKSYSVIRILEESNKNNRSSANAVGHLKLSVGL